MLAPLRLPTSLALTLAALAVACGGATSTTDGSSSAVSEVVAEPTPECPDPNDPAVEYLSHDPTACAAMLFACEEGQTLFTDECGCGCIGGAEPPPPTDAGSPRRYVGYGDTCQVIYFVCEAGEKYFADDVGCGCEPE
jgi:hypothetical protein